LTGRVTAAVLPRRIDAECPTLLLDESDATFKHGSDYQETLRGVLNSGYKRSGTTTMCAAGTGWKVLSTFCPKAIAGIGTLPSTVIDRCIPIKLKRRLATEKVESFSAAVAAQVAIRLRAEFEIWGLSAVDALRSADVNVPGWLNDRTIEVWTPLLAIADMDIAVELLFDIAAVFDLLPSNDDVVPTAELLKKLTRQEEWRWATYKNGRPLSAHALAQFLKAFDIFPSDYWVKGKAVRAYRRATFTDALLRYGVTQPQEPRPPLRPVSQRAARCPDFE